MYLSRMNMITSENLDQRLQDCYTGAVYDVLREIGYTNQVLPNTIIALEQGTKIAGEIFTISGKRK